jgi:hypothetical protein
LPYIRFLFPILPKSFDQAAQLFAPQASIESDEVKLRRIGIGEEIGERERVP